MKQRMKRCWGVGLVALLIILGMTSACLAYEIAEVVNGATISGKVTFQGTPPAPKLFKVKKNPDICGERRALAKVEVKNGFLKGAVIALEGINKGKPFETKSVKGNTPDNGEFHYSAGKKLALEVQLKKCNFGPFTGVLTTEEPVRFANEDPMKHVLHTYAVRGRNSSILRTVHNRNIPSHSGIEVKFPSKKFKNGRVVVLTCDRHDFMENWLYVVQNPYFSISDPEGNFTLDQVPPGRYDLVAWHPVLGLQEQEVTVGADGKVNVDFEFSK